MYINPSLVKDLRECGTRLVDVFDEEGEQRSRMICAETPLKRIIADEL